MIEGIVKLLEDPIDAQAVSEHAKAVYRTSYPHALGPKRLRPKWLFLTGAIVFDWECGFLGFTTTRTEFDGFYGRDLRIGLLFFTYIHLWWYRSSK